MRPPPYELIVTMASRAPRSVAPARTTTSSLRTIAVGRSVGSFRWVPAFVARLAGGARVQ